MPFADTISPVEKFKIYLAMCTAFVRLYWFNMGGRKEGTIMNNVAVSSLVFVMLCIIAFGCPTTTPSGRPGTGPQKPNQERKQFSDLGLMFELVETSYHSPTEEHVIYTGWMSMSKGKSAFEAFQYLRENPSIGKNNASPENNYCCAGRLNGKFTVLDEFLVLRREQFGDTIEYIVKFRQVISDDFEPEEAEAYFCFLSDNLPPEAKTFIINFKQYTSYLGSDGETPLGSPVLKDVKVNLKGK